MRGLTVRWSLVDASDGVLDELRAYVAESSLERFTGKPGLAFKTWRASAGEWFEGSYVFVSDEERATFQDTFSATAGSSPVSQIVGSAPILVEPCEVVAIAEGGEGFTPST